MGLEELEERVALSAREADDLKAVAAVDVALTLLHHFHAPETGALLAAIVQDAGAPAALRAAAVTGLAGQPLDDQPETLALVVAALTDDDPRIGVAAVEALDGSAAGRKALQDAAEGGALSPKVRAAIDAR